MSDYIMSLRKQVGHRPLLQVGASVIVEDETGRILLQLRHDNHCWGYPGGSVELDEVVEDAARRELLEETGLVAGEMSLFGIFSGPEYHYVYPNGDEVSNIDIVFLCRDYEGELKCEAGETDELRFFGPHELPENLSPPVRKVILEWAEKVGSKSPSPTTACGGGPPSPGKLKLVKLTQAYEHQLGEMLEEWMEDQRVHHTNHSPGAIFRHDYHDFDNYLARLERKTEEDGRVPNSVFFLLDEARGRLIGAADIRHYLNEDIWITGGHIGDGIRPSERGKGYGTKLVALALKECRNMGIFRVLMTCDKENTASVKTITGNGGVLENTVLNEEGIWEQRYWIDLHQREIYLAGGCFWGTQHYFDQLPGVLETKVGYANGITENPTYQEVCTGLTAHAETVRIRYDERIISLTELLEHYFRTIDPLSINRQGGDVGLQYRTGIYYEDEALLPEIRGAVEKEAAKYHQPLAVELKPLDNFYPGEEYHQDYLNKNPGGYCHIPIALMASVKGPGAGMKLIEPTLAYDASIQAFKQEFLDAGDSMDGCGPLRQAESTEEWLYQCFLYTQEETHPTGKVPATQLIYVRKADEKVVGMLQIRHRLNEYLGTYGGHIGYAVRPSERRKGYAAAMLKAALPVCRSLGLNEVLITCRVENEGSRRTILKNGGRYDGTVHEKDRDVHLERYWITL